MYVDLFILLLFFGRGWLVLKIFNTCTLKFISTANASIRYVDQLDYLPILSWHWPNQILTCRPYSLPQLLLHSYPFNKYIVSSGNCYSEHYAKGNYGHFQICRLRTTTAHSDYEWFVHTRTRCKYIRNRLGINRSLQRIAIMNTSRLRSILLIVTMSNFAHSDYEQFGSRRLWVILLIVTMSDFAHIDYEWFCS